MPLTLREIKRSEIVLYYNYYTIIIGLREYRLRIREQIENKQNVLILKNSTQTFYP